MPVLTFWDQLHVFGSTDTVRVDLSTNEGATWTQIWSGGASHSSWSEKLVSLEDYAGQVVRVRFVLVSSSSGADDGWYVDDIAVQELEESGPDAPPVAAGSPFRATGCGTTLTPSYWCDDFEDDLSRWVPGDTWGFETTIARSGNACIADSPGGDYVDDADASIRFRTSLSLTDPSHPMLSFWDQLFVRSSSDVAHVEVSSNADRKVTASSRWSETSST